MDKVKLSEASFYISDLAILSKADESSLEFEIDDEVDDDELVSMKLSLKIDPSSLKLNGKNIKLSDLAKLASKHHSTKKQYKKQYVFQFSDYVNRFGSFDDLPNPKHIK